MARPTLCIIDIIGLTYDPTTLDKYGLGGSESAVIFMARDLSKLGFDVTVLNNCIDGRCAPGVYDDVTYRDLTELHTKNDYRFDVVISSRTVMPFIPADHRGSFNYPCEVFEQIKTSAKLKILWLHDTFCSGDHLVEEYVVNGYIDQVFTLSDFHTSYFANCNHGRPRNFEVLKDRIFMTRNGVRDYFALAGKEVDVRAKDPNLFVYNASVSKGMVPLLERIWPEVKRLIPPAKLKIVGGYYKFRDGAPADEQENTFHKLRVQYEKSPELDVEFLGIIPQREIAELLAKASFTLYPAAFPETFGISTLESLTYNTPIITCRFGALEETAITNASYFIDYAIVPNSLFPAINTEEQIRDFIALTVWAHGNPYLHAQKVQACNIIKGWTDWGRIALQWKQQIFKTLGLYLDHMQFRQVDALNHRVHRVFKRRFSNEVEWSEPKRGAEQPIVVITPFFNAKEYLEKCVRSVATQDYDNYRHLLINDCSTDGSDTLAEELVSKYRNVEYYTTDENQGALKNHIDILRLLKESADPNTIIVLLDGDDALVNDNTIFTKYNNWYAPEIEFTYGSMWSMADNIPLIAQPYPEAVRYNKTYRQHLFQWGLPYTHLRTFRLGLFAPEDDKPFTNGDGTFFRSGGDGALFYYLIERAAPNGILAIPDIVYLYNDMNPINDYKVNGEEQNINAKTILNMNTNPGSYQPILSTPVSAGTAPATPPPVLPKKKTRVLIGVPTAKYIEVETFKSMYDLDIPDNVEVDFQYFFGYQIDQIRNKIAEWTDKGGYDYLFSVDSDIVLPRDALTTLLSHDKDIISGVYLQRRHDMDVPEIFMPNQMNGMNNIDLEVIRKPGLYEIGGCGFGCVLIKTDVLRKMGYPQFTYISALDHAFTFSEDVFFCTTAREHGFRIFVDSSVRSRHIGANTFEITDTPDVKKRLRYLSKQRLIPQPHLNYLYKMRDEFKVMPKVIYDIGACVLHWQTLANEVWPAANVIAFEAMKDAEFLYKERGVTYHIDVLGDEEKIVEFFENPIHPGGNSMYKESAEFSPMAEEFFPSPTYRKVRRLDDIVAEKGFPAPSMIKMDVQGAELDILRGSENTLKSSQDLILELQDVEYNKGAPLAEEVIAYLASIGFDLIGRKFSSNTVDGDYHFRRR